MARWLQALFDPRPIARQAFRSGRASSSDQLLAVLMLGDLPSFAQLSSDLGYTLPHWLAGFAGSKKNRDSPAVDISPLDGVVIEIALAYVAGRTLSDNYLTNLRSLYEDEPITERDRSVVAAILTSLALRSVGDYESASVALQEVPPGLASVNGHAALRLHGAAVIADGLASGDKWTEEASGSGSTLSEVWRSVASVELDSYAGEDSADVGLDCLIRGVAQRCLMNSISWTESVTWEEGFLSTQDCRRAVEKEHSLYLADLAESMLSDQFEAGTERGNTRRVLIGGVTDKGVDTLGRALLRAQCMADAVEVRHISRLLARHQVTQLFGSFDSDPASAALETLVAHNDKKGVSRASWILWTAGPQLALKRVAERTVQQVTGGDPSGVLTDSSAELLRLSGDLLDVESADALASFCLLAVKGEKQTRTSLMDYLRIAASLAGSASDEAQSLLVQAVLSGSRGTADDTFFANLARQIRWEVVELPLRRAALDWCADSMQQKAEGSAQVLSEMLAFGETETGAARLARSSTRRARTVSWAGALWNISNRTGTLLDSDLSLIESICTESLAALQERAARATYGLASGMAGALLVRLGIFASRSTVWEPLIGFLLDPSVQVSDKSEALDAISHNRDKVPIAVRRALRRGLPAISKDSIFERREGSVYNKSGGVADLGIQSYERFAASLALGALSRSECLSAFAELAAAEVVDDRLSAAAALDLVAARGLLPQRGSREALVSLTLALCGDASADVRSNALLALAQFRPVSVWQAPAVVRALEDGLRTSGILVPLRTLGGLLRVPLLLGEADLLDSVRPLLGHDSAKVRMAAASVLASSIQHVGSVLDRENRSGDE